MLVNPICHKDGYFAENCEGAATIVPSVEISQRVENDLDMLRSILKILIPGSIPKCKCLYLQKFIYFLSVTLVTVI